MDIIKNKLKEVAFRSNVCRKAFEKGHPIFKPLYTEYEDEKEITVKMKKKQEAADKAYSIAGFEYIITIINENLGEKYWEELYRQGIVSDDTFVQALDVVKRAYKSLQISEQEQRIVDESTRTILSAFLGKGSIFMFSEAILSGDIEEVTYLLTFPDSIGVE